MMGWGKEWEETKMLEEKRIHLWADGFFEENGGKEHHLRLKHTPKKKTNRRMFKSKV